MCDLFRGLGRYALRVAVRRVVLLLVLIALAGLGIGSARADTHPDMPSAYSHCITTVGIQPAPAENWRKVDPKCDDWTNGSAYGFIERWRYQRIDDGYTDTGFTDGPVHVSIQGCPSGAGFDKQAGQCTYCMQREPISSGGKVVSSEFKPTVCYNGCSYRQPSGGVSVKVFNESTVTTNVAGYVPSGPTCTTITAIQPVAGREACAASGGGLTTCVRDDGKVCATASTGKKFCWNPHETGVKTSGDALQKRDPGQTATPPTPPPGETYNQTTTPQTVQTGTGDGRTSTTTIVTYNTGSGADTSPGTGTGVDGDGNDEGDDADLGTPGPDAEFARPAGAAGRTKEGVINGLKNRIGNSPIVSAATGFFEVQAGGSCPVWTLPETAFSGAVVMDYWCDPSLDWVWTLIGSCCLIVYAWAAFKIAIL